MSVQVPEIARDLLDRPLTCVLVTMMPDGQPQATPVWFDFDGENIRINTALGRQKARNMTVGSKVTISIIDPENDGHWLEWRGHVAETKDEAHGAREHMNGLSMRYRGEPVFVTDAKNELRQMYLIAGDKINAQ